MAAHPTIILLWLEKDYLCAQIIADFINGLKSRTTVKEINEPEEASALFRDAPRVTIYALDGALADATHYKLRAEAASFVFSGGTIIFAPLLSELGSFPNMDVLFASFLLPWSPAQYVRETFELNPHMTQIKHAGLVDRYHQHALSLKNVDRADAIYARTVSTRSSAGKFQVAAAIARVRDGKVGYIGDMRSEEGTEKLLLAMLGLN